MEFDLNDKGEIGKIAPIVKPSNMFQTLLSVVTPTRLSL